MPFHGRCDRQVKWVQLVGQHLKPTFGGFATFVVDPDDLLEEPEVREELNEHKLMPEEWSGARAELLQWLEVAEDLMPVVKVSPKARRHLIDETLPESVVIDISISVLFPRMDADVVRAVPKDQWDLLLRLQDRERPMRTRRETALMVARAVYGIDPIFVRERGWDKTLADVAATGAAIPSLVACELVFELSGLVPDDVLAALQDPAAARHLLKSGSDRTHIGFGGSPKNWRAKEQRNTVYQDSVISSHWKDDLLPTEVQRLSIEYAGRLSEGLSEESRLDCNTKFQAWIEQSYDQIHSSKNGEVLRIQHLVDVVDSRVGPGRALIVVIDGLGLDAWFGLKDIWFSRGVFRSTVEESGFAILPTITSLSRRALFEGRIPPNFESSEEHSPALERKLWHQRFSNGRYFEVGETQSIKDAIYQGCHRLAVVDISWDRRGHALDPETDTLSHQAVTWGGKEQPAGILMEALKNGYRVFVTADHGQVGGVGVGRPNVGVVPEERSKRVLMFASGTPLAAYAHLGETNYQPITLPRGRSAVFAPFGSYFGDRGASAFSHGGPTIEEVMIPFVELLA
jgi:hypothetical protein